MIVGVETFTESQTGKTVYRKRLDDDSVERIGRGEFMRLWFELTGRAFPDHPAREAKEHPGFCDHN